MSKGQKSQRRKWQHTSEQPSNPVMKELVLEVVDNQLRDGTPLQTRQTYDRLMAEGYSSDEARRLIGCVVVHEIFDMLKNRKPYDEAHFVAALERLPQIEG
jgi:hypothetical protein